MIISTFGTKICDDAVKLFRKTIVTANRLVEISPFTVAGKYSPERECWSDTQAVRGDNPYLNMIFEKEYGNQITSLLKAENAGRIVIDLAICRNSFMEFTFDNGKVFRITESNVVKNHLDTIRAMLCNDYQAKIVAERVMNPLAMSYDELEAELSDFAGWLKEEIGVDRVVLLKVHNVYLYLGKDNRMGVMTDRISMVNHYNGFYDKCADIFLKYIDCPVIEVPCNLLGEEQVKEPNIFHYTRLYYEYINKCLHAIEEGRYFDVKAAILEEYETRQRMQVEEAILCPLMGQSYNRRNGRKLILIGENPVYEYNMMRNYGIRVAKKVSYTPDSKMEDIIEQMQDVRDKDSEYLCIVPNVYPDTGVLEALWRCGYGKGTGYMTVSHDPVVLSDFTGSYQDYYNNKIISKSPVSCEMEGSGIRVTVGTGSSNNQMKVILLDEATLEIGDGVATGADSFTSTIYDGAKVFVGKNVYFGNRVHMRPSYFNRTVLGDNVHIGDDTILFIGDGHAIIDLKTGDNINYDLNHSRPDKHRLIIGNNVRVGDGCFILSGADIGDNCIVRERSFVNKKFGDNCYLAGHPAKTAQR